MLGRRKKSFNSCFCSSDSRHPGALNRFGQVVRGERCRPHTQYICLTDQAATRRGETPESSSTPQAAKETGLVFHSFPSLPLLFLFSLRPLFSIPHPNPPLLIRPVCAFSSAFPFRFFYFLAPFDPLFLFFPLSLVNISLTSSFVQVPVRVLGLGRQPLSSQVQLSPIRFFSHSYSRTRRFPVSPRATMSASGDDTPLVKSNGKPGELLSVYPVIPSVLRSPRKLASFLHYTQPRSISPRHPLYSLAFSIESLFLC